MSAEALRNNRGGIEAFMTTKGLLPSSGAGSKKSVFLKLLDHHLITVRVHRHTR